MSVGKKLCSNHSQNCWTKGKGVTKAMPLLTMTDFQSIVLGVGGCVRNVAGLSRGSTKCRRRFLPAIGARNQAVGWSSLIKARKINSIFRQNPMERRYFVANFFALQYNHLIFNFFLGWHGVRKNSCLNRVSYAHKEAVTKPCLSRTNKLN